MNKVNLCWVISEGRKGHEVQSTTLAKMLATDVQLFRFNSHWLQKLTAPNTFAHQVNKISWQADNPNLETPPDMIISCGRLSASVAKYLKLKTASIHIQILNPKGDLGDYDLLLLPKHDNISAPNVCQFTGSIHGVRNLIQNNNKGLCRDCIAVMIGNPCKEYWKNQWSLDWERINKLNQKVIICGSPRLSDEAKTILKSSVQNTRTTLWLDNKDGSNPYSHLLLNAKQFFVTADSINMMNECLATGQTVQLLADAYITSRRHKNFIQSVEKYLSVLNDKDAINVVWPDAIDEISNCTQFQNLLKSPSSFNKG